MALAAIEVTATRKRQRRAKRVAKKELFRTSLLVASLLEPPPSILFRCASPLRFSPLLSHDPDPPPSALTPNPESIEENLGGPSIYAVAEAVREWLLEHNEPGQDDGSMYAQMMRRQTDKKKEAERPREEDYEEQVRAT
jgi:hypothetical protein